jgi:uncharacterized repeat protein (TIGR03837 family)
MPSSSEHLPADAGNASSAADASRASVPPASDIACDIFCAVIDNFGDIGVCWRLARQLRAEHGWQVRLFVDDLKAFHALCPAVDPTLGRQSAMGVTVEHWHAPSHAGDTLEIADVVIEAFGCELPAVYVSAMARRERKPVWVNLEYLSAEDWVADFHLRPSPHPRYALDKTFFFPGMGPGTGGVLKERTLDAEREAFRRDIWWRARLGMTAPPPDTTVISMFAYENPAIDTLLEQWRDSATPIALLVPEGRISGAIARFFELPDFLAGSKAKSGSLKAYALGFVEQPLFDSLLWAADINFVRGEDSFVRAQWAQKPFVWQIYPQADDAHLPKLDAALAHYASGLPAGGEDREHADHARASLGRFWHAWNGAGTPDWSDFWQHRAVLEQRAADWATELASIGDLAGNLAEFAKSQLK